MQFHILANYDHATIDKIRNVGKCENLEKNTVKKHTKTKLIQHRLSLEYEE